MHVASINRNDYFIAFKNGEEEGFAFFFRQLHPALCLYAFRFTKDQSASEEIVSNSFIKIWEKHWQFNDATHIKHYVHRVVKNDSLKWLRRQQKEAIGNKELSYLLKEERQPDHFKYLVETELMHQVYAAIKLLPKSCRTVFELLYIQGKSIQEVADELNLSVSTIKTQKARGLATLRKNLPPNIFVFFL